MRIDNLTDRNGTPILPQPLQHLKSTLLMTGKMKETGITVELIAFNQSGVIQIDMNITLATGNQLWMINAKNSTQFGRWTNIGLHWTQRTYNRPGMLELYLDGHRRHTTSEPLETAIRSGLSKDGGKLYVNRAIYSLQNTQQESEITLIDEAISNISELLYYRHIHRVVLTDVTEERGNLPVSIGQCE
ncbi:hypothetical protein PHET_07110 [Paragonimus heterotremus]|uniref:Uncharacterized protein n=1 Tax=Paragonimus heterotremus TaxID=100268 RepID=A0A8J4WQ60_9TREM|nr:hypothetical protein PHET_07110 [Paragonimus heterotremus]